MELDIMQVDLDTLHIICRALLNQLRGINQLFSDLKGNPNIDSVLDNVELTEAFNDVIIALLLSINR